MDAEEGKITEDGEVAAPGTAQNNNNTKSPPRVLIPIADGSEDIETVTMADVLRRAKIDVVLASVMPDRTHVVLARGCRLAADANLVDCVSEEWDLIALPGGMPGAEHLRDCPELITLLRKQKESGKLYGAICASPAVVLLTHDLIDSDVNFTCYPTFARGLARHSSSSRVVLSQNCVTSQGPGTAMEFSLELVKLLCGEQVASATAGPLLLLPEVTEK